MSLHLKVAYKLGAWLGVHARCRLLFELRRACRQFGGAPAPRAHSGSFLWWWVGSPRWSALRTGRAAFHIQYLPSFLLFSDPRFTANQNGARNFVFLKIYLCWIFLRRFLFSWQVSLPLFHISETVGAILVCFSQYLMFPQVFIVFT